MDRPRSNRCRKGKRVYFSLLVRTPSAAATGDCQADVLTIDPELPLPWAVNACSKAAVAACSAAAVAVTWAWAPATAAKVRDRVKALTARFPLPY